MIESSMSTSRLLHVSDLHLPNEAGGVALGQHSDANLVAVLGSVPLETVDAVVVTGDVTHDGDLQAYQRAVPSTWGQDRTICAQFSIGGNHGDSSPASV
jgi:DNA repair exonuclease SbcCD nuclease subunit